ncbi:MAG: C4-dicarboxylate ABC transporter [Proteobacteria bacterium ST_bin15]|nr:MAG: C4-dicarboxylate ABC transporter [Proteobacteria bacterium ST_bin15]
MGALLALSRAIDGLTTWVGRIVAWAIFAAVIVSTGNAIVRKLFDQSSNSWLELQWYLFGAVFMLCSAWTLLANEHIRIDIVNNLLPVRARNWIDVIGHVLFLLPLAVLMVWTCIPFVYKSFIANEQSLNAGGLIVWPAKAIILVGFAMLLLQGISELIKRVAIMRGELEDVHGGGHHAMAEAEAQRLLEQAKAAGLALELDGKKS